MKTLRITGKVMGLLFLALVASNVLLPAVARAQFAASGGASVSAILAALVGQTVSATRYTASASSGTGFGCDSALASCVSLGPGAKAKLGSNSSGEILIGDGTTSAQTVRVGELTFYGNGWIQSAGLIDCNHNCYLRNAYTGEPVRIDDPDGVLISDTGTAALDTCSSSLEGVLKRDYAAGGTTGLRTRLCICTSDGGGTPAYAWRNLATGTVGTSTTCAD